MVYILQVRVHVNNKYEFICVYKNVMMSMCTTNAIVYMCICWCLRKSIKIQKIESLRKCRN